MAADNWLVYESAKLNYGNGVMDFANDTFHMQLHTSTYVPTLSGDSVRADLSNELPTANGYTVAGAAMTVTYTQTAGVATFDSNDVVWTASGGSLVARFAIVYDNTPTTPLDPLVCYTLLDNTPADITATDGNTLTVQIHANGLFQLSGGITP